MPPTHRPNVIGCVNILHGPQIVCSGIELSTHWVHCREDGHRDWWSYPVDHVERVEWIEGRKPVMTKDSTGVATLRLQPPGRPRRG